MAEREKLAEEGRYCNNTIKTNNVRNQLKLTPAVSIYKKRRAVSNSSKGQ
jgi:hypothetical protein